jgi:hypothetical protein
MPHHVEPEEKKGINFFCARQSQERWQALMLMI